MTASSADFAVSTAGPYPWFRGVSRTAFAAKGVLHLVLAAIVLRGDVAAPSPATYVLLVAAAVSLVVAAAYKALEAFAHPDVARRSDAAIPRLARVLVGIGYGALAIAMTRRLLGAAVVEQVHWTARLLNHPLGPTLVTLLGLVTAGFGCQQFYRARTGDYVRRLDRHSMTPRLQRAVLQFAALAYAGRGVAFSLIGAIVVVAAATFDAGVSARGVAGQFEVLEETAGGLWILRSMAGGLAIYGLYCLTVLARYFTPREPLSARLR